MKDKKLIFILLCTALFVMPNFCYAEGEILDSDGDGLSDDLEKFYYTDPNLADTDHDGFLDGEEVNNDYSPHIGYKKRLHEYDYDKDGLNDWLERWFGSDIGKLDTDDDGINDFEEVMSGYKPNDTSTSTRFARKIVVDRTTQRLFYYVDGVKVANFPVSTGIPTMQTPKGEFKVTAMIPKKRYIGPDYNLPNVWWNMEFLPMYYIHAAYWHNNFGLRTESHGCVNMRYSDAELLYKSIDLGVPITVTGTTPSRYYVGT
ncbi:MAG: L,D-transpeptidase family protein [Candidatus Magasanikbacteria bacterium]|nr:L,D-transpeptidase family protein [Candidatus Magasanikbacteria bacterium]